MRKFTKTMAAVLSLTMTLTMVTLYLQRAKPT